ncbi:hypothetical protein VSR68_04800 [Paraburkholderia phymatum]|uniref:hypothetical protein n=1 Tax=Paraburkholderia phymatum TaxID=148447 RepID=UPI00317AAA50
MSRHIALTACLGALAAFAALAASWLVTANYGFAQGVLAQPGTPAETRDPLSIAAANAGVRQCAPVLGALSSIGGRDARNSDVLFDWDRRRADVAAAFTLVGLEYAQGNAALSLTAVPEADGSCSVAAERIAFDLHACKEIAQRELHGYQATPLLAHMTVYTRAQDRGSSVSLIDSPPGCLTIRRYVKYSTRSTAISAGSGASP